MSLIGDAPVIEKILRHLKLCDTPERPPPRPAMPPIHYHEQVVELDDAGQWPDATALATPQPIQDSSKRCRGEATGSWRR
jgi:hypothetical protein